MKFHRRSANKYHAVPTAIDGHRFDSKMEAARYSYLKLLPEVKHIDVHPVVTLPGGVRWTLDFCVWLEGDELWYEDVKSPPTAAKTDFRRNRQQFDQLHPAAPLRVVSRKGKAWVAL